ncbi:MAG: hypothetical protein HQL52_13360 [Magnetococcales bacterium]|nr:hypothetical protein [Magnetococcales bacterium]
MHEADKSLKKSVSGQGGINPFATSAALSCAPDPSGQPAASMELPPPSDSAGLSGEADPERAGQRFEGLVAYREVATTLVALLEQARTRESAPGEDHAATRLQASDTQLEPEPELEPEPKPEKSTSSQGIPSLDDPRFQLRDVSEFFPPSQTGDLPAWTTLPPPHPPSFSGEMVPMESLGAGVVRLMVQVVDGVVKTGRRAGRLMVGEGEGGASSQRLADQPEMPSPLPAFDQEMRHPMASPLTLETNRTARGGGQGAHGGLSVIGSAIEGVVGKLRMRLGA